MLMLRKFFFTYLVVIVLAGSIRIAQAEHEGGAAETSAAAVSSTALQAFVSGSYPKILAKNAGHPFILAIWSVNCPSCIKDMALLKELHQEKPNLKIILLAADEVAASEEIQQILGKIHLSDLESWVFAEENTQKLRFEMDPKWYGEIPRTYFFDAAQHREGVSGVLTKQDYQSRIDEILR